MTEPESDRLGRLLAEERQRHPIRIYTSADTLHPIAVRVQKKLEAATPDKDWGQLRCQSPRLPYVRVTRPSMPRALLILSSIMEAFDDRNWRLTEGRDSAGVIVDGEPLYVSVEETARRVHHVITPEEKEVRSKLRVRYKNDWDEVLDPRWKALPTWDYISTNQFTLRRRYNGSGMADKFRQPIEGRLGVFISGYLEAASTDRVKRLEWEERDARSRAAAERRLAAERQHAIDQAALKQLLGDADRWATAERVRAYVRAALASETPPQREGSTEEWAAWANHYADQLDPTRQ